MNKPTSNSSQSSTTLDSSDTKEDYYVLLGVTKTASEAQIKTAYRKLALKYHPDRNHGSAVASEQFKIVSEAYSVLSDPNSRRQYDLGGHDGVDTEFESVDVTEMGRIGRVFGALLNNFGMPIPTQISQTTLSTARDISEGRVTLDKPGEIFYKPIVHGREFSNRVNNQDAHFYSLTVSQQDIDAGVLVTVRSKANLKFKLVLFDSTGAVALVQESASRKASKSFTAADLLFTTFEILDIHDPWNRVLLDANTELPELFTKLSGVVANQLRLTAGTHLLGIYGDNWLSSGKYTAQVLRATRECDAVTAIQTSEREILEKKAEIATFQEEYVAAKARFEAATTNLATLSTRVTDLLSTREKGYDAWLVTSSAQYTSPSSPLVSSLSVEGEYTDGRACATPEDSSKWGLFSGMASRRRKNP